MHDRKAGKQESQNAKLKADEGERRGNDNSSNPEDAAQPSLAKKKERRKEGKVVSLFFLPRKHAPESPF